MRPGAPSRQALVVSVVLQMENGYNALLVALDANQDEELLPPEGYIPAGPITPEGPPCHCFLAALFPVMPCYSYMITCMIIAPALLPCCLLYGYRLLYFCVVCASVAICAAIYHGLIAY